MNRQTYLVLLIRYQLNLKCRRKSEIMAISGQQYFNQYFHPSQNLPKTDHAFTAFIRGIPALYVFFHIFKMLEKR